MVNQPSTRDDLPILLLYSSLSAVTRTLLELMDNASEIIDLDRRPTSDRSMTFTPDTLQTRTTKAVDLRAPPYTKKYIDDYRQRIKADPDPEAHFAYARYLIDAAKRIGSDAKDQRAVKKYRDLLIKRPCESSSALRRRENPTTKPSSSWPIATALVC
jgi:hypothetical protein